MDIMILDPTENPSQDNMSPLPLRKHPVHQSPPCFRKEIDSDGICWLTFDTPDASANVWNADTLDELDCHIEDLHRDSSVTALVIRSAKEKVFIAGADLKALRTLPDEALNELMALGQDVFTHLESLRIPKVAAIHGACVGGGYELTLACDWRVASDSDATRIGLPETQLGLVPAWGGCTRLSRLIGLHRALDLIVPGKTLKPIHAKKMGLVHEVVPVEHLDAMARRFALKRTKVRHHHFHFTQLWPIPQVLRFITKAKMFAKFPWMKLLPDGGKSAPEAAVDVITHGASRSFEHSLAMEQTSMRALMSSGYTRRMIDVFFMREAASKKLPAYLAKVPTQAINNVAVIGAGVMGSGIAYALACKGPRVLVSDTTPELVARGFGRIGDLLENGVRHHALTQLQARDVRDRVTYTHQTPPLHHKDLIIEAVVEDMKVKKALFADLAKRCHDHTILATNTSALSVTEMASAVPHPERVIGLHFFNPAHLMPLVEVVTTEANTPEVIATAMRFVQSLGKTPILVKDRPGFVVNRILMPYMLGAVALAESMRDPWLLDEAMTEFGMPMGPLRLLDEVGFDVALHVEKTLRKAFGDRIPSTGLLRSMMDAGMLGRKNKAGFYTYDSSKPGPEANPEVMKLLSPKSTPQFRSPADIAAHLHGLMSGEAQRCLDEGVAANASDIELAMILGAGHPPFRPLFSPQSTDRHETDS
jgi:3-hydroxyacyl-CoA dehydrogenase/enoyl-CoA hydratase/3-hydroxybutyryl-CoA epimerase